MIRTLMCLPLCLVLAPNYPGAPLPESGLATQQVAGDNTALGGLPDPAKDVLGFLQASLKSYHEKVQGYTCTFRKREFLANKLRPWETISASYREKPHSALFNWQEGMNRVIKAMYVEGENKGTDGKSQILALPAPPLSAIGVQKIKLDSEDSKSSGRYQLHEFGIKQATERVVKLWTAANERKELHTEYLGLHEVPEAGDVGKPPPVCHKIRRHKFAKPENDVAEVILFIDRDTLFQVGTILHGDKGQLIGEYYFRDIRLNPAFPANQFDPAILKAKK